MCWYCRAAAASFRLLCAFPLAAPTAAITTNASPARRIVIVGLRLLR